MTVSRRACEERTPHTTLFAISRLSFIKKDWLFGFAELFVDVKILARVHAEAVGVHDTMQK